MKFAVKDKNGTILHSVDLADMDPRSGMLYALCLLLYTLPSEDRDGMIAYILDVSGVDYEAMAKATNCSVSTVLTRLRKARQAFGAILRDNRGVFDLRSDMTVDYDDKEDEGESEEDA